MRRNQFIAYAMKSTFVLCSIIFLWASGLSIAEEATMASDVSNEKYTVNGLDYYLYKDNSGIDLTCGMVFPMLFESENV